MGRPKGVLNKAPSKYWSKEEKYEYVELIISGKASTRDLEKENGVSHGMVSNWVKKYQEQGMEGLQNKRKPGNPLTKFAMRKELTPLEHLQYENMK